MVFRKLYVIFATLFFFLGLTNCQAQSEDAAGVWQNVDFADAKWVERPDSVEKLFVRFVEKLNGKTIEEAETQIKVLLQRAESGKAMYRPLLLAARHTLFDADLPLRNDCLYRLIATRALQSKELSEAEKERSRFELSILDSNPLNKRAADFTFKSREGEQMSLQTLKGKNRWLTFFFDPDCMKCQDLVSGLRSNLGLNQLIQKGKIKVLAIDVQGDRPLFERIKNDLPPNWIVGIADTSQDIQEVYDLRSMPTVYLLDKKKKVKLRNATFGQILEAIASF